MLSRQKFSSNSGKSVHLPSSTPAQPCAKSGFVDDSYQFIGKKRAEISILSKNCYQDYNIQQCEKQEFSFLLKHLNNVKCESDNLIIYGLVSASNYALKVCSDGHLTNVFQTIFLEKNAT